MMNKEKAKTFLCSIAGDLGFTDIENYTCKDGEKMREAIKALEQDQWIPVSERLPEEEQRVIVTLDNGDVLEALYGYGEWALTSEDGYVDLDGLEVIAWMPLPDPYKASPTGAEGSEE